MLAYFNTLFIAIILPLRLLKFMKRLSTFCLFLFLSILAHGQGGKLLQMQGRGIQNGRFSENDTLSEKFVNIKLSGKTKFTDYKIISYDNDTSFVDTTLSIKKDYQHSFNLKDNFELLLFGNMGQTATKLGYNFNDVDKYPILGATSKLVDYYTVKDINYYRVPTPTTIFTHKTGFQQGQMLNSFITMNTSPRFNFSMAYQGLRSLGFYRNELSSHGHVSLTMNYKTKNDRYTIRGHLVSQDLINDENGGISPTSVIYFKENNPRFTQRSRLDVNLSNANSVLRTNRYYFEQDYKLWHRQDSVTKKKSYLKIGHVYNYQLAHYEYNESGTSTLIFGKANSFIEDKLISKQIYNQVFVALKAPIVLGELSAKLENFQYNYGYTQDTTVLTTTYGNGLKGNSVAFGGAWKAQLKHFYFHADASNILTGPINGNQLKADAIFKNDSVYSINAGILVASKSPNFNFLLYRSAYDAYNWENHFINERYKNIHARVKTEKYGAIEAQFTNITNFTYFGLADDITGQTKPEQANNKVSYFKIKVDKEFRKGKFGLDNTLMFNNVSSGSDIFRVPTWSTRNTVYFESYVFKGKPLFLQTGITFRYFNKFYANNFNPLLNEFSLQNDTKIGGFPILDFFVNAQIQRTRIFFKVEHFNASFTGYNYFTAPNYPYRDLSIRFGLVWNFFI